MCYTYLCMRRLLIQIVSAGLGLYLATLVIPGVSVKVLTDSNFFGFNLTATWQIFILLAIILGLLNFFVKPILDVITLPLRILTLGLFSFVINMALIFVVDSAFRELTIPLYLPLAYTSLIIVAVTTILSLFIKENS